VTDWHERAACRRHDPDLWFSHDTDEQKQAVAICRRCPLTDRCLQAALDNHETDGIWGGTLEADRARLARKLGLTWPAPRRVPTRTCDIAGCDGEVHARRMCRAHYDRVMATGTPLSRREQAANVRATRLADAGTIVAAVADRHGLTVEVLTGDGRSRGVVAARREAMWCLRESGLSLPDVGRVLGRDHSTVLHGLRRFAEVAA
jgi:WhiB family transcriptional regulator, redox-sensing transcriptional regulator